MSRVLATLQTKHMTLALDLTEAQQEKVMELNLEEAKIRKARWDEMQALKESGDWKKPTDEERLARQNERLDNQIAFQAKMKEVLNEKQYDDWKEMRKHKAMHGKKKMQKKRKNMTRSMKVKKMKSPKNQKKKSLKMRMKKK